MLTFSRPAALDLLPFLNDLNIGRLSEWVIRHYDIFRPRTNA